MTETTWKQSAFVAAPLCLAGYGLIRLVDSEHGPGPDWTLGHLALLGGLLMFAPVFLGLRRLALEGRGDGGGGGTVRRAVAGAGTALGLLGMVAAAVQAGIDLVVGACAADRVGMDELFGDVQSVAGVKPAFYTVGPLLFHIGLLILVVQLAALRRIAAWRPLAVVVAIALPAALGLDLMPVAGLLLLLVLAPLGERAATALPSPAGRSVTAH
ncbi:hypothetical protein GCM10010218_14330 [Streptomyces mashuensis]|uniref:Uncharacterized protein n=1 Tax=Streptomyces mashuensis TaxID=33904 RepID=A0A919B1A0_9ACTN|nr:hypothetical protein [Streptomyces mashuensis]GHF34312.1 hypothetical protein GCM10010218_14330 [Streptomyces mashuensis]